MVDWITKINYASAFVTAGVPLIHELDGLPGFAGTRRRGLLRPYVERLKVPRTEISSLFAGICHFDILMPLQSSTRERLMLAADELRDELIPLYSEECRVECHLQILGGVLQRADVLDNHAETKICSRVLCSCHLGTDYANRGHLRGHKARHDKEQTIYKHGEVNRRVSCTSCLSAIKSNIRSCPTMPCDKPGNSEDQ